MTDRTHDDNGTRIAHEIEARLHHGEKTHAVIHDELHKLQKLDSHHGVVDTDRFKHDVHKVEHKLHKDGYLPNLHLKVDHNNHVHLEKKNNHQKDECKPGHEAHNKDHRKEHSNEHSKERNKEHNKKELPHIPKQTLDLPPVNYPEKNHYQAPLPGQFPRQNRDVLPGPDALQFGNPYPTQRPLPECGPNRVTPGRDNFEPPRLRYQPNGPDVPYTPPRIFTDPSGPPLNLDPYRDPNQIRPQPDRDAIPYRDQFKPMPYRDQSKPMPYRDQFEPMPYRDQFEPMPYRDPNPYQKTNPYESRPFQRPDTERFENQQRPPFREFEQIKTDGEFKELKLDNRSSNHAGADALVYVRKDFDPSKPVHLVVYNHGFESTVSTALKRDKIKEMMSQSEANTVLVMPEWQASPGSRSGSSGPLGQQSKFANMIQEAMQKTPALQGASLNNVDKIDIIAHSAGYSPTETQIYKNPALAGKVHSITLLDSLYDRHGFDSWLQSNIADLSAGRKQFYNFSNSSTASNSRAQAQYVQGLLRSNRLPTDNYVADYGSSNGQVARHGAEMAQRSIVFASTTVRHGEIPAQYIGSTLTALNPERFNQRNRF